MCIALSIYLYFKMFSFEIIIDIHTCICISKWATWLRALPNNTSSLRQEDDMSS